jgi:acetyl-CoA synthetase
VRAQGIEGDAVTTDTERFAQARNLLLQHAGDLDAARAAFTWPQLSTFNWVWDWFDPLAARLGDTTALVLLSETTGVSRYSFRSLAERSLRLANTMRARGVKQGDRILVLLPNVVALWETVLAAMRLGAVIIPATPQLTPDDVDDRCSRGLVKHMVTDREGATRLRVPERLLMRLCVDEGVPRFQSYAEALESPAQLDRPRTSANDPFLLYFTSGTTAKPKLVAHTHQSYPVGHLSTMYWQGLREGDVHQNIGSPGWAKHAWSSVFAPWNAGATVFAHDYARFSGARTLELLREHQVSSLCAPPTVWRLLMLEDLGPKPPALRSLVSAGEPLNPEVIDTVQRAWGLTIRDGYGQTETTAQVGNTPGLTIKPGSMGKPLPGYELVLLDAAGLETNEGELAVKLNPAPTGMMVGYLDDEHRTEQVMASGYYRTGDEARRDADGYFWFIGRADDVFKSADYRISPFELENVLIEHRAVAEAAIVPSPDPVRLTVPKAFVTLRPGFEAGPALAKAIFEHANARLAAYKRIRRVQFAELPKTISGKIRRVELRKLEAAQRAKGVRSPHEHWLEDP